MLRRLLTALELPPCPPPTRSAVLSLDDDIMLPCADLERAFARWRASPTTMLGFFPRLIEGEPRPEFRGEWCVGVARGRRLGQEAGGTEGSRGACTRRSRRAWQEPALASVAAGCRRPHSSSRPACRPCAPPPPPAPPPPQVRGGAGAVQRGAHGGRLPGHPDGAARLLGRRRAAGARHGCAGWPTLGWPPWGPAGWRQHRQQQEAGKPALHPQHPLGPRP